jgi:hypothetical protein
MIYRSEFGHPLLNATLKPTVAQLKLFDTTDHLPGELFRLADGRVFAWNSTSVLTADDIFVIQATGVTTGRYLLAEGFEQNVALPIGFGTADAAVLATTPTNSLIRVGRGYWEVTTGFTGGSSSAIGLSSSAAGFTTKGDLLGGASGDVAATLVAGNALGTIGAKTAAGILLPGGSAIRFDRITSAFTAGAGLAHLLVNVLANPGA